MSHSKPAPSAQSDLLVDSLDLSKQLKNVSPRSIERWRTTGEGPAFVKVGRRVLYRQSAVERWLDQKTRLHTNDTSADRRR